MPELRDVARTLADRARLQSGIATAMATLDDSAAAALADSVVVSYGRTVQLVEAVANDYGFRTLYVRQPSPGSASKSLTPFEQAIVDRPGSSIGPLLYPVSRYAAVGVDSVMKTVAGANFLNLAALFVGETGTIWLDDIGHVTEGGNVRIANRITRRLREVLPARAGGLGVPWARRNGGDPPSGLRGTAKDKRWV